MTFFRTSFEGHGPTYNLAGAALDKHRRAARKNGLMSMPKAQRDAYGEAVEKSVLAAQRRDRFSGLGRLMPDPENARDNPIGDALLAVLNARLLACPSKERRARTDEQWRQMYADAMEQKAKAEEARKLAAIDKRIAKQQRAMKLKPKAKTQRRRAA